MIGVISYVILTLTMSYGLIWFFGWNMTRKEKIEMSIGWTVMFLWIVMAAIFLNGGI